MPLLTFKQLKDSRVPKRLGYCPTDDRFREDYNFTQEQLLAHGRWWRTIVWVQFCVDTLGCVVLPRNIGAVERWAANGRPSHMENWYWSFIRYVGRIPQCNSCGNRGSATGSACPCGALYTVQQGVSPLNIRMQAVPGPAFVKLYPRSTTDVGKRVLLQGYDGANQWVRKQYPTGWVDGEYITLASPFAISSSQYVAVTGAQKDLTNESVLVHSYNAATFTEVKLAEWDSDEENPSYQVYQMPKSACVRCRTGVAGCSSTVDALVKLEHIPVRVDTDWLLIGDLVAIEHAMRAQQHYANNRDTEGDKEMVRAINQLNHELRTHTGDRTECYVDIGTIRSNIRTFSGFR